MAFFRRHLRLVMGSVLLGCLCLLWWWQVLRPPQVTFGDTSLMLEFATTTEARARGLGGRAALPDDYGMLFVFPEDDQYGFWMKDTLVSLDLFWLDAERRVVHIEANVRPDSYPEVFRSPVPARYVLETNSGFAEAHGVVRGTVLRLPNVPRVSE